MGAICSICGNELTAQESIDRGMGYECYKAYRKALIDALFSVDGFSLKYNWFIQVEVYKREFIERFKETKFRKEFKRNFYNSICSAERISKKQLNIMTDWLSNAGVGLTDLEKEIDQMKQDFVELESDKIELNAAAIESARKKIRATIWSSPE